jgi:hypothetical protein
LRQFSQTSAKYRQKAATPQSKIAVALQDEFGRVPTEEEIDHVISLDPRDVEGCFGLHYKRKEQKKSGQLAIFSYDLCSLVTPAFQQLIRHS